MPTFSSPSPLVLPQRPAETRIVSGVSTAPDFEAHGQLGPRVERIDAVAEIKRDADGLHLLAESRGDLAVEEVDHPLAHARPR